MPPRGPRLGGGKFRQPLDDLLTQTLAAATALGGQPPQGNEGAWRSVSGAEGAPIFEEPLLLHVCVVEVAQHSLELFQRTQDALEILAS